MVLSHCSPAVGLKEGWPSYIQTSLSSTSVQKILIVFFTYGGQVGNAIFIICSAWFLIENFKNSYKKILGIIFDVWCISILLLLVCFITDVTLTKEKIVHYLFPITFNNHWFVVCYLIFYTVHPLLNRIIATSTREQLFKIVFIGMSVYGGAQVLMPWRYYYNDLVGFIVLYFVTAYVKKYIRPFSVQSNLKALGISLGALVFLVLITNVMGLKISVFSNQLTRWNTYINPLIILLAISLLRLFLSFDFSSLLINRISSVSLIVYLLHYNSYTGENIIPVWFKFIYDNYSYRYLVVGALILAGILFALSELIAQLYKIATSHIKDKVTDWELNVIKKIYYIAYENMDKLFHYED